MGYLQIPVVHDAIKTTWSCACKSNTNLAIINGNWDRVFFTVQKISNIPNYNRPSTYNTSLQSWCILQLSVEDSKIKHTVRSNYDVLYQWAYHSSYKHATSLNIITNPVYCKLNEAITSWGNYGLNELGRSIELWTMTKFWNSHQERKLQASWTSLRHGRRSRSLLRSRLFKRCWRTNSESVSPGTQRWKPLHTTPPESRVSISTANPATN